MSKEDIDYSKSVVYKICCKNIDITDCYVGSTVRLRYRKIRHKTSCNNEKDKGYNIPVYQFIRDNGGWDNWEVVMLEEYPECKSKDELLKYEREHMEMLGATLNKVVIGRPRKEWEEKYRENNREQINRSAQKYRQNNKEEINAKRAVKVECEFCGSMISKGYIAKHQRTKKCLEAQSK